MFSSFQHIYKGKVCKQTLVKSCIDYIIPRKIDIMYPYISDICDRFKYLEGTPGPGLCPKIVPLCQDILKCYSKMDDFQIEPDALVALFGCSVASLALPHTVQQTLGFGMLVAKRIILSEWKATSAPLFSRWLMELLSNRQGFHDKFESTWGLIYRRHNFSPKFCVIPILASPRHMLYLFTDWLISIGCNTDVYLCTVWLFLLLSFVIIVFYAFVCIFDPCDES